MRLIWRFAATAAIACAVIVAAFGTSTTVATALRHTPASPSPLPSGASPVPTASPKPAPLPSPSLSPGAQPPTPYMPLEQIPNGKWLIIQQPRGLPLYSTMTLTDVGTTITGKWQNGKDIYYVSGTRQGAKMTLDLRTSDDPKTPAVGKVSATLDGIADMFGLITLNGTDTPFQGAQHSRVPPPVEPATEESPSPNPF